MKDPEVEPEEEEKEATHEEQELGEIDVMQRELEAMLSKMDKVDPVALLVEKARLDSNKMNADLAEL